MVFGYLFTTYEEAARDFDPFVSILAAVRKVDELQDRYIDLNEHWAQLTRDERMLEDDEYFREIAALAVYKTMCVKNLVEIVEREHAAAQQQQQQEPLQQQPQPTPEQQQEQLQQEQEQLNNAQEKALNLDSGDVRVQMDVDQPQGAIANLSQIEFHREFSKLCAVGSMTAVSKSGVTALGKALIHFIATMKKMHADGYVPEHVLISLVLTKLDVTSQVAFSMWTKGAANPTCGDLLEYLKYRKDNIQDNECAADPQPSTSAGASGSRSVVAAAAARPSSANSMASMPPLVPAKWKRPSCAHCGLHHPLHKCKPFKRALYADRLKTVDNARLCHNCLQPGHAAEQCAEGPCLRCKTKHNSVLCYYWDANGNPPTN